MRCDADCACASAAASLRFVESNPMWCGHFKQSPPLAFCLFSSSTTTTRAAAAVNNHRSSGSRADWATDRRGKGGRRRLCESNRPCPCFCPFPPSRKEITSSWPRKTVSRSVARPAVTRRNVNRRTRTVLTMKVLDRSIDRSIETTNIDSFFCSVKRNRVPGSGRISWHHTIWHQCFMEHSLVRALTKICRPFVRFQKVPWSFSSPAFPIESE